ncbi:hypothetical protein K438DRAFT_1778709 [Mycena galopus ATCC 62051]|nr:hypothetical protein K438DRAFT_1778709 [Mycena galopus ATCC 62051]
MDTAIDSIYRSNMIFKVVHGGWAEVSKTCKRRGQPDVERGVVIRAPSTHKIYPRLLPWRQRGGTRRSGTPRGRDGNDDSEIPTREVVEHVITKCVRKGRQQKQAGESVGLVSSGDAKDVDAELPAENTSDEKAAPKGRGMRTRRPNTKYAGEFWRHTNNMDQDIPVPGINLPLSTK